MQDLALNVPFLVLSLVLADSFVKSRCGFLKRISIDLIMVTVMHGVQFGLNSFK